MSKYSTKIADAIQEFLHDDDWHYTFREEKGTFHFSLSTRSRLNTVDYFIAVREDHYRVLCISPLNVNTDDAQELARMAEFITRANYGMTRGCFEMDYHDGEIRFRMAVDCDGDAVPTREIIRNSVYVPASMFNRYGSGMVHTIFSDLNPAAIVRACESEDGVESPCCMRQRTRSSRTIWTISTAHCLTLSPIFSMTMTKIVRTSKRR